MGGLSLSESDGTVLVTVVDFSVINTELTSLELGSGSESALLDFFTIRLVALDCDGEAGDAVREVSLTVLLRLWPLTLSNRVSPLSPSACRNKSNCAFLSGVRLLISNVSPFFPERRSGV